MAHRQDLEERAGQELDPVASAAVYADLVDEESTIAARLTPPAPHRPAPHPPPGSSQRAADWPVGRTWPGR